MPARARPAHRPFPRPSGRGGTQSHQGFEPSVIAFDAGSCLLWQPAMNSWPWIKVQFGMLLLKCASRWIDLLKLQCGDLAFRNPPTIEPHNASRLNPWHPGTGNAPSRGEEPQTSFVWLDGLGQLWSCQSVPDLELHEPQACNLFDHDNMMKYCVQGYKVSGFAPMHSRFSESHFSRVPASPSCDCINHRRLSYLGGVTSDEAESGGKHLPLLT